MDSVEKTVSRALAAHPGWMSAAFLQAVTGIEGSALEGALHSLLAEDKALRSGGEPPYWRWADPGAAESVLREISDEERVALHRRLFDYMASQQDTDTLAGLLAHHAERAGLGTESFLWNLRSGQVLSAAGQFEEARKYLQRALSFAADGNQAAQAGRQLGNLDCHLGRFDAAEAPYRAALQALDGTKDSAAWVRTAQSLAAALVEQGKYGEALGLLEQCRGRLAGEQLPLEQTVIRLHMTQVFIGMGLMREADASLKKVRELLAAPELSRLAPYEQLLQGKLEIVLGRMAAAFRIFEDAARGFEAQGDLAGKLEVLLSISAPLMEHYLIREAQSLIDQVSAWEDLKGYPALEHSVHLRRLSLGAFSGKWVQDDLHLLSHEGEKLGRAEDWLQFWFHMSLAARRLKEFGSAEAFLQKARAVVERIASGLGAEQRESFLRRPDIARIWRLSAPREAVSPREQKVRARRSLPGAGPAEVATLAPPTSEKNEK